MLLWLNGQFVERDSATISVFDAGVQHGVGLFETMLARHGRVFRAAEHMRRLIGSARDLLLTDRLRADPLIEAIEHTLARNTLQDARVRLTITGGDLNVLQSRPRNAPHQNSGGDNGERKQGAGPERSRGVDPTILIVAQPPTEYPETFFTQGVRVTIADGRENPLSAMAGHKTLNYWPRIRALQEAAVRQAGEALWFSVSNHLCGGCVSNVFLVKGGNLLTPIARGEEEHIGGREGAGGARAAILPAPVLPGVTREAVIQCAQGMGTAVTKRMLTIDDVLGADEVFLTNSSWGVLPVVGVEKETIAGGEVGEVTKSLREAWLATVERESKEED